MARASIPVIDLFAGPGGLGEGFSAFRISGLKPFQIELSIEKDPFAHSTLRLRSFLRRFRRERIPCGYYDVLRGVKTIDELFENYPEEAKAARNEAWKATLGITPRRLINTKIGLALKGADPWVLIGGPPCQAYSIAGRSRNGGIKGYKAEEDYRQFLYVEYLQVIVDHWPAVFVMENVKGLLTANIRKRRIFENILEDLQSPGKALVRAGRSIEETARTHSYRVLPLAPQGLLEGASLWDYVVEAERHGVPQARHRVILIGIRDDLGAVELPKLRSAPEVHVHQVTDGLPRVRSGLSKADSPREWLRALQNAPAKRWLSASRNGNSVGVVGSILETISKLTLPRKDRGAPFIEGDFAPDHRRDWFHDPRLGGISQHQTRSHLESDLYRYLFASSFAKVYGRSPMLNELPADLLPDHKNVEAALSNGYFNDRFRVQLRNKPASTITSHIAKDGHYYIHHDPSQCRSLTLREAARLQTFPDNYFFCGPRTMGYIQVGNAVPPLLATNIAASVYEVVRSAGLF